MSRYHIHISSNTIYLINTNVGPTTHPYYTKFRDHCRANKPDIKTIAEAARCAKELQTIFPWPVDAITSYHHVGIKWTQFFKAETHKDSDAFNDETRET